MADYSKAEQLIRTSFTVLDFLVIHGNISLALRHPENTGLTSRLAKDMLLTIEELLLEAEFFDLQDIAVIRADRDGRLSDTEYQRKLMKGEL